MKNKNNFGVELHTFQLQFHKSYQKTNKGIRKHEDYQDCIAISYYDAKKLQKNLRQYIMHLRSYQGAFVNG